jgi:hypothetical protein
MPPITWVEAGDRRQGYKAVQVVFSGDDGTNDVVRAVRGMSGGGAFYEKHYWGTLRQNLLHGEEEIWLPLLNDVFQGVHG